MSFKNLIRPGRTGTCSPDYKVCGGDLETQICVLNEQKCPINKIEMFSSEEEVEEGYTSFKLGTLYLGFRSDGDEYPLIHLQLSET